MAFTLFLGPQCGPHRFRGTNLLMKIFLAAGLSVLGLGAPYLHAQSSRLPAVSPNEARESLWRATSYMRSLSTGGGYLWIYSLDLQRRAGESVADANHIWIQPPGTPTMGEAYLRAYAATGDTRYLDAARDVADALGRCQLGSGGWHYSADMVHFDSNRDGQLDYKGVAFTQDNAGRRFNPLWTIETTFDDDNTQSAVRFLTDCVVAARSSAVSRDRAIRATLDRALEGMLRAQYPNGAWPECYNGKPRDPALYPSQSARIPKDYPRTWPNAADYTAEYTLNDHSQRDCILTLLEAAEALGEPRYQEAAKRGGDFLVQAQLPEPQPAWAQQYNFQMEPAWARAWEPPAVVSCESGGALEALMALHLATGDPRFLAPLQKAVAWFERVQVAPGRWARYYELGTNRPVYGDRDGRIYYSLAELSEERRTGYNWVNSYGLPKILAECRELLADGRDTFRRHHPVKPARANRSTQDRESAASRAVSSLDVQGRWVTQEKMTKKHPAEPAISTKVFAAHVDELCDFIEASSR